jgi:hypothetical protein
MKILFASVAIATTMVAVPAFAESEIGCRVEEPVNSSYRSSSCDDRRFILGSRFVTPMPWYDGSSAFAYVPSRSFGLRRGMRNDTNSLHEETELEGGAD